MQVKKTIYILILLFPFFYSEGQDFRIDSITKALRSSDKKHDLSGIKYILKHRTSERIQKRLDSIPYDYAFIKEVYCSVSGYETKTIESYFRNNEATAFLTYIDGEKTYGSEYFSMCFEDIGKESMKYYDCTLENMKDVFSDLKPVQQISYAKTQIYMHACLVNTAQYKQRRTTELKHTWQIKTSVKKGGDLKMSVQYPDPDPEFKIRSCGGKW
ncbi:MAG: hypothetical protein K0S32_3564 [Bacteroidetes bacterium]|jgi:hypothetical protein|nr:hypothetical protein [Bacteroidota bacterium]